LRDRHPDTTAYSRLRLNINAYLSGATISKPPFMRGYLLRNRSYLLHQMICQRLLKDSYKPTPLTRITKGVFVI